MIKTLHNVLKRDRERFTIPKTVQDIIPVKTIWNDGIFKVGNLFSKTFQFSDINYAMLSAEDTKDLFLKYSDVINSFEYGATYKLTIPKFTPLTSFPLRHQRRRQQILSPRRLL